MKYLLDTDTCIAVLRGVPSAVEDLQRRSPDDCIVISVTAFALFAGVEKARVMPIQQRLRVRSLQ